MSEKESSSKMVLGQTSEDHGKSASEDGGGDPQPRSLRKNDTEVERIPLNALLFHVLFGDGFLQS